MKSVVAMMMMMMMVMVSVSAGPLPPASRDDQDGASLHLLNATEDNSTRLEFHQSVNASLDDITGDVASNTTMNGIITPAMFDLQPIKLTYHGKCVLSTCLTANLGSALQGGDQMAGGATTDPFGVGKK